MADEMEKPWIPAEEADANQPASGDANTPTVQGASAESEAENPSEVEGSQAHEESSVAQQGASSTPWEPPVEQIPTAPEVQSPGPAGNPFRTAEGKGELDRPGLELLYDVELEATLQFGSREMMLRDVLELGPGDVVELDRHIAEPVDLVVGDRIVARGEVVVASGNFALRVTEVAAPQMRLESIRCLF